METRLQIQEQVNGMLVAAIRASVDSVLSMGPCCVLMTVNSWKCALRPHTGPECVALYQVASVVCCYV